MSVCITLLLGQHEELITTVYDFVNTLVSTHLGACKRPQRHIV